MTLLCEACGYVIEGLGRDGHCPECGRVVGSSLPEARTGTPWQVGPTIRGWLSTNWGLLRRPGEAFARMRPGHAGRGRPWPLALINLSLAAFLIVDPLVGVLAGDPLRAARGSGAAREAGAYLVAIAGGMAGVVAFLLLLMWLEMLGVRFFARRRGWRLTKAAAWNICCHASVGWIFAGLLPVVWLAALYSAVVVLGRTPHAEIPLGPSLWPWLGRSVNLASLVSVGGTIIGYFAGMMVFETLVWVGVRRCRFAALPRAAAPTAG